MKLNSLLGMADETLMRIADHISPLDLENFAATSSRLKSVSADALALHARRKQEREELVLYGCDRHYDNPHPLSILCEICEDWRVAYYPRTLSIKCCDLGHVLSDEEREAARDWRSGVATSSPDSIAQATWTPTLTRTSSTAWTMGIVALCSVYWSCFYRTSGP